MNIEINKVLSIVNEVFIDILDNSEIHLTYQTTSDDIEEWDSLNHIQLIVAIEKRFKLRFSAQEITQWKNVGEMCEAIVTKS